MKIHPAGDDRQIDGRTDEQMDRQTWWN